MECKENLAYIFFAVPSSLIRDGAPEKSIPASSVAPLAVSSCRPSVERKRKVAAEIGSCAMRADATQAGPILLRRLSWFQSLQRKA
jgi:hypothetical protein